MEENKAFQGGSTQEFGQNSSNVKESTESRHSSGLGAEPADSHAAVSLPHAGRNSRPGVIRTTARRYDRFGETIRYLTWDEWLRLLDAIDDYRHKLMFRLIYHLGCRVGEFVRIRLRHLDFRRNTVFIPAENTKTGRRRTSHVPVGLMNEIKSTLKREGRMLKRSDTVLNPDEFLFRKARRGGLGYTENRVRQVFQRYVERAGLHREYGRDSMGRCLHEITVHSLRHAHIMHHIHIHKLPLPIVQKQVGHRTLKATSVYLNPSDEAVGQAYAAVGA